MARVLVIEDNPMNMELAVDLLEVCGHEVLQAVNAEDGIRMAQIDVPDLILMDLSLPGMDGLAATRQLKKLPSTRLIPVVALTAHAMEGDEKRAVEAGCCGYLTKPLDSRRFGQSVVEFLETFQS